MSEKIPPHKHCHVCGKSIPLTETICSEDCKQKLVLFQKRKKMNYYLIYAFIAIMIALILVSGFINP